MWITTGYGIEGVLPDVLCKRIVEQDMKPNFKNGDFFGGLDQMYQSHKKSATFAYGFILTHFFIMSISGGFHLNISLGKIALIGISVWVLLALAPRIPFIGGNIVLPYHIWKFTHRFIGLFFLVAVLHLLRIDNLLKTTPVNRFYVFPIVFAAVLVYYTKNCCRS
jgi:uncharacterized membrane protein YgcG